MLKFLSSLIFSILLVSCSSVPSPLLITKANAVSLPGPVVRLTWEGTFRGTGFAVNAEGCVVTASHVVEYISEIAVEDSNKIIEASYETVGQSVIDDIAILCPKKIWGNYKFSSYFTFKRNAYDITVNTPIQVTGYDHDNLRYETHQLWFIGIDTVLIYPQQWKDSLRFVGKNNKQGRLVPIKPGYSGSPVYTESGLLYGMVVGVAQSRGKSDPEWAVAVPSDTIMRVLDTHKIAYESRY